MASSPPRVALIEYGVGNLGSVLNACRRCGVEPVIARTAAELDSASPTHILLPGVGAVGEVLANLRAQDLEPALRRHVLDQETPLLGICVGMQMLADSCEEHGEHTGLGFIPGRVKHLGPLVGDRPLPHIGWNTIRPAATDDPLWRTVIDEHFYFLHSYAFVCEPEFAACQTEYGGEFVSGVKRGNVYGVQFHPEKSSAAGMRLLDNFFHI